MKSRLIIDGNLEVSIQKIVQWHTYSGLLEGLPTERMNNGILSRLKDEVIEFCGLKEIYIITPEQTPIHYEGKYPFGKPVKLPNVICIAELSHYSAFRDKSKDCSALGLAWFQDDYAFPIETDILDKIKEIPYRKICGEFEY